MAPEQILGAIEQALPFDRFKNQRVLTIVPDGTRTAPIGDIFKALHGLVAADARAFDVLIALGTHQPMSEAAICKRLEIQVEERASKYSRVRFFNHTWDQPQSLVRVGTLPENDIKDLTHGRFAMEVQVDVNRMLFDYDQIIIIGPVFPHEVVGFSGGNKYLFPGVGGPEILNFFHWLGAVVTNPMIIGHKWTPVRRVVDRAAAMIKLPKLCFALVVHPKGHLAGLFAGNPESAWDQASELSRQVHITRKPKPFRQILSCSPPMYDELWTAGKCMYKLEPVLADGGELIIYAPHLKEISVSHGTHIRRIGYHCRDFFLKQWDRYSMVPWGVLAHSSHVRGLGMYENGVERCRAQVTLASQIPKDLCVQINLGYRDPNSLRASDFEGRETDGVLLVPKAGEMLFQLDEPAAWARGET